MREQEVFNFTIKCQGVNWHDLLKNDFGSSTSDVISTHILINTTLHGHVYCYIKVLIRTGILNILNRKLLPKMFFYKLIEDSWVCKIKIISKWELKNIYTLFLSDYYKFFRTNSYTDFLQIAKFNFPLQFISNYTQLQNNRSQNQSYYL